MDNDFKIETILVNEELKDQEYVKEIIAKFPKIDPLFYKSEDLEEIKRHHNNPRALLLAKLRGKFLFKCPGTTKYSCCNYQILNVGVNCWFKCAYCILQDYFKTRMQVVYADIDHYLETELVPFLKELGEQPFRFGTGEFTDSLYLDDITGLSKKIVHYFRSKPNALIEFKTKSVNIGNFMNIDPSPNIIIAWSVNTPRMIRQLEPATPSLVERLEAVKRVVSEGYNVSLHFDPIVLYDNCLGEYEKVIDMIFEYIPSGKIRWISLGGLRFTKGLKDIFIKRSPLFIDEFVLGDDNKYRYLRMRREKVFRAMYQKIKDRNPGQFVYLCMEPRSVWQNVFGFSFQDNEAFEHWFNQESILKWNNDN